MGLRPVYGHEALRDRLAGTMSSGRFPQAALFTGVPGVGKQRLALWVAQGLLCDATTGPGVPCDACSSCRQVRGLAHPDLHWFVPIPRPKAADPEKQLEEARERLGEAVAERRSGLWRPPDGMTGHPLASIRLLVRTVFRRPFKGPRKVLVLGDAERLVVQESTPDAANALLKVLEEPPADTTLLLTAAEPQGLLPTIRSRVVLVRVAPVPDDAVRAFLAAEPADPPATRERDRRVAVAAGSVGRALWQDEAGGAADRAAGTFLAAVRTGAPAWGAAALGRAPWSARGDFAAMLDALALALREEMATCLDASDAPVLDRRVRAIRRVEEARADTSLNLNPQLALATLARDLEALV